METIQLLDSSRYLGPMPPADGVVGHHANPRVHDGWVVPHGRPERRRAVLKAYTGNADPHESRELLNEIVGHHLATSLGFPVPEAAGIIEIERSGWPDLPCWADMPQGTESATAWWTLAEKEPSIKARFNLDLIERRHPLHARFLARIRAELAKAPDIPGIVAFDELIANVDRNIGNLLGPRAGRYVLIDHGQCLTGPHWVLADLDPAARCDNKLMILLDWHRQPLAVKNSAVAAMDRFQPLLPAPLQVLTDWLADIIPAGEASALLGFLTLRSRRDFAAVRLGLIA